MGRIRRKDTHLPDRLFESHGGYFYASRTNGRLAWLPFGRDQSAAVAHAERLNAMARKERLAVIGAYRAASEGLKQSIHERDGFACVYCGAKNDLGIDHLIPYSKGGSTKPFNIVTACSECNASKGASDPREHILAMLGIHDSLMTIAIDLFRDRTDIKQ